MPKPTPTGRPCRKCGAADPPRYTNGQCAPCHNAYNAARYKADPEPTRASANARYKAEPEKFKARAAAWRRANPQRKAALSTAWAKANPGKIKAANAAWYKANVDRIAAKAAARYKADPEKANAWKRAHPEQAKAASAAWVKANAERVAANKAAWAKANAEHVSSSRAAKYRADPEQAKARVRAWRRANPDKFTAQNRQGNVRRRALLADVVCVPYFDPDIFERDGWLCQLCDQPIDPSLSRKNPMGATIDHIIPVSKGGDDTPENAGTAHRRCNTARGNRSIEWARARLIPAL